MGAAQPTWDGRSSGTKSLGETPEGGFVETVLSAMPGAITAFDARSELTYCNDAAARMCGFESARAMLEATREQRTSAFEILDIDGRAFHPETLPWARALAG